MPTLRRLPPVLLVLAVLCGGPVICPPAVQAADAARPNLLVIIADDLGFLDLGTFGSEVATPNLDRLAETGLRLSNFHAAPTCAPSRSMLLSGTDNHLAGLGTQENLATPNQQGHPAYAMRLSERVVTLATLLRDGGYRTYLSGKWHLGVTPEESPGARGFERWVALLQGGGGHFDNSGISPRDPVVTYQDQGRDITLPADFYTSDYFASRLIEFLSADAGDERPFFAYLAFTAPHWPLQAPDEDIARYHGAYDEGYGRLRAQRIERARRLGIIPRDAAVADPVATLLPWEDLTTEQRRVETRKMEVYAAMIHRLDWNVGRVLQYLDDSGSRHDTLVLFLSDNGAEGHLMEAYPSFVPWLAANYDNSYENIGRKGSFVSLGAGWAHAANGPLRLYKGYMSEGGTRVPAIVNYAGFPGAGKINDQYATVMDIAPTLLDLAGVPQAGSSYKGREVLPIRGSSMRPMLAQERAYVHAPGEAIGWELFGRRALHQDHWKALWLNPPYGPGAWQLYDMSADPGETADLAASQPELLAKMVEEWSAYAESSEVILPDKPIPY